MATAGISSRRQFLFYYNNEFGHVECVDVSFNANKNEFTIINANSADGGQQYHFLKDLHKILTTASLSFVLYACQANIQRDVKSCSIYAYAIGSEIAKRSIDRILSPDFFCDQSLFADCNHFTRITYPTLPIQWFCVKALGKKLF